MISYKYPKAISTLYTQDYKQGVSPQNKGNILLEGAGRQKQFILADEKRNVKIKYDLPMSTKTTSQVDYKPFLVRS